MREVAVINMEEKEKIALRYFSRNALLYTDMSECVSRGAANIVYAALNGVLLYEKESGVHMLAAEEIGAARTVLKALDESALKKAGGLLVAHGEAARTAAYEALDLKGETACYQVVYTKGEPRPLRGLLEFRRPEREQIELIKRDYHLESPENIEKLCAAGRIFCGFLKGAGAENLADKGFVGFIGKHPEGSMGLLQVFPEYRRRGCGEELENFMINEFLKEGRIPYGHVIVDNSRSMNLQHKLGYEVADEKVYWLFER